MKIFRWVLKVIPFLYMGLIWFLSSKPADAYVRFSYADSLIKESMHLIEFAILYVLFVLFLAVDGKLTKKANWISAVVACLYGLTDEIHQFFVPYRSCTVIDLIKDVTGVTVCFIIVYRGYFLHKNRVGSWLTRLSGEHVKK